MIQDLRDNHGVDVDGIGTGPFCNYRTTKQHITDCFNILMTYLPIKVTTEFDAGNDSMTTSESNDITIVLHLSITTMLVSLSCGVSLGVGEEPAPWYRYERNDICNSE